MQNREVHIGVCTVVLKEGKVLLGQRVNCYGEGQWAPPGGHLEKGESLESCAARELLEETGLRALSFHKYHWAQDYLEDKHYIIHLLFVDRWEGNVELLEPEKCAGWHWFDWDNLPSPLFHAFGDYIAAGGNSRGQIKGTVALHELLNRLLTHFKERDWEKFHSPKNLAMNLASEVGELIEHFRWLTEEESHRLSPDDLMHVQEEIGDVFIMVVYLSHKLQIDPLEAAYDKLLKVAKKYPVHLCKGKSLKYTAYEKTSNPN